MPRAAPPPSMLLLLLLLLLPRPARATAPACTASVYHDTKCPDKAYRWTDESGWEACCATCAADTACLAWVYAANEAGDGEAAVGANGNCHLKHNITRVQPGQAGSTCGIFPGGAVTPAPPPATPPPPPPPPPRPTHAPDPSAPRPHFIMLLQDDLGFDDVGFHNPASKPYSSAITQLAAEGIVLTNHYVHWHCSPTRRSFLTGRLPIHHGEMLSGDTSDDIDLRWNILSQKLHPAGYRCLWYGKGHTGYKSMAHLPTNRGFEHWTGFMGGAQSYTSDHRWKDGAPYTNTTYSSYLYGDEATGALASHDPATPLMMYLPWQAVHGPYDVPPDPKPAGTEVQQMLWAADEYVGRVVDLMKDKGMWEKTLVVYSADNGGVDKGTNWPKRGEKHTNFQGGMNVAAFVSGGFLPAAHRGASADVALHIVDWYATFCVLAGVDPTDDSPASPLPVDPSLPPSKPPPKDIYGADAWAGVDGVDVWPILLSAERRADRAAAHAELTLSREVLLLNGTLKIVVAQPDPHILAMKDEMPPHNNLTTGWRDRDHTTGADGWLPPNSSDASGCGLAFVDRSRFQPCVFDIAADPREMKDLSAARPELLEDLWGRLNRSYLTYYHSRTPEAMLGSCNKNCAKAHWQAVGGSSWNGDGPVCGVAGC